MKKQIQKSNFKNIDLKRKRTKFDTKKPKSLGMELEKNFKKMIKTTKNNNKKEWGKYLV